MLNYYTCIHRYIVDPIFNIYLQSLPGLEQYAVMKFAEALEVIPRAISENAGAKVN